MPTGLAFPDLDRALAWLRSRDDAAANLILRRAGVHVSWGAGPSRDRERLADSVPVVRARATQHRDGSWGENESAQGRILSTLWVVKAVTEAGLESDEPLVSAALRFLDANAFSPDGYFSTSGTSHGVLPCYVGLSARLYAQLGCADVAARQRDWLHRYQQVAVGGEARRHADKWGHDLDRRYGGCFAGTSCLIGVARAAEAWGSAGDGPSSADFDVARQSLLERGLAFRRRDGQVLDLPSTARRPKSWTAPAFPTDWRIDLVEMLIATGAPDGTQDARAQRAIDLLSAEQRADGSWARGWHATPPYLKGFGASPRGQGNPIATARVVSALVAWGASAR
jgi:hypothetical protein